MADRLLPAWGVEVSARGVAGLYAGLADAFVLDAVDAGQAAEVAALGLEPVVVPTLMRTVEDAAALAKAALEVLGGAPAGGVRGTPRGSPGWSGSSSREVPR
jgi:LPPG:FO 2-phospho-L-lactate transferase